MYPNQDAIFERLKTTKQSGLLSEYLVSWTGRAGRLRAKVTVWGRDGIPAHVIRPYIDCSRDSSPPGRFPLLPMIVDAHRGGQIAKEKAWIAPLLAEAIVHPQLARRNPSVKSGDRCSLDGELDYFFARRDGFRYKRWNRYCPDSFAFSIGLSGPYASRGQQ